MRILAINPGSTSTKIAVFEDLKEYFSITLRHSVEELSVFKRINDQYDYRKQIIIKQLEENGISIQSLDAVVGRGGILKPIPGGVYRVNDALIKDLTSDNLTEHASNLGGLIANSIAKATGKNIDAYIVDPVVVDELEPIARISGMPENPRVSIFHALNQKAVARRYARENNQKYEDVNLIVVHLGGGITVGAHCKGKVIDVNNGLDGEGPLSPERAGTLPVHGLIKLCYSGKYTYDEMKKKLVGQGGMVAYLGTNNAAEVEKMIENGDENAKLIYEAIAYQIAKEVGAMATVFKGKFDAIIITGGIARSEMMIDWIKERVDFLAKVVVYPGEDEMQALAESVYYALNKEMTINEYM